VSLRRGIVVEVHPDDHSVDLVMADNGQRLIGVQVQTSNGSTRSGSVDLPDVPKKANKWDVSKETGQDQIALVSMIGRNPVVTGFLFPQINQMLSKDPKLKSFRHQSDVGYTIDGEGNFQYTHPGGAYIRIGETPDLVDNAGKNADGNSKVDRNTGRKVNVRVGLAGNVVVLTMTPEGVVTMTMEKDFNLEAKGGINMKAEGAINMIAKGAITMKSDAGIVLDAPTATNPNGDIIAKTVSLLEHPHDGIKRGDETSNKPVQ
jgi:hypothetical protein